MELLRRFAQGDVEALEALFQQFQGAVYGWILRIVREPSVADELTVEAFWRAYRSRTPFDPEASFGAWTRRIATNLAIDYLRKRRATVELPEDLAAEGSPDAVLSREMREKIRAAFCRLPAKLRAVSDAGVHRRNALRRDRRRTGDLGAGGAHARVSRCPHFA